MVLWELTLATAYWLGLRKTYRLALRLQRRLAGRQHPRLRDFIQRRTRNVFDVALTVHKEIQERDLSAGRNLGNFILRFLDRMRPSAHIRGSSGTNDNAEHGKLLLGRAGSDRERSALKHVSGTKIYVGKQAEAGSGLVQDRLFVSHPVFGINIGQAIRNRISLGLSRIKPGIGRLKPGLEIRTSVGVASRFWGQPVREKQEISWPSASSGVLVSPAFAREQSKSSFPKEGIFREDIAQWMLIKSVPMKQKCVRT